MPLTDGTILPISQQVTEASRQPQPATTEARWVCSGYGDFSKKPGVLTDQVLL